MSGPQNKWYCTYFPNTVIVNIINRKDWKTLNKMLYSSAQLQCQMSQCSIGLQWQMLDSSIQNVPNVKRWVVSRWNNRCSQCTDTTNDGSNMSMSEWVRGFSSLSAGHIWDRWPLNSKLQIAGLLCNALTNMPSYVRNVRC